ncbi:transposon Ty3-I Gag-Pol polyprotein, partial [Trichonephila clavata]
MLIADELGEIINPEMKVLDLKILILNSDKYKTDKVFIDDYLDSIIADRKSKEEQERLTEQSKLEFEKIKLEQIKLEIELGNEDQDGKSAESASLTAAQKQKSYGDYFNKRSSVKNFSIREQVVLLIPDSSNKIYARGTGPGEIIQHHPPHSYKVKLPDGTVRHVHVNKIRKYHPRALAVGVIFEDDHEFREIHPTPNLSRSTSKRVLHETDLNHLKETEREQVLAILLKHRTLFTSDVKIAK